MNNNELGELIKAEREIRGLSIRQLAKVSGISYSYLSNIESGYFQSKSKKKSRPSIEILEKLSESLNIPKTFLLEKSGYIDKIPKIEPELAIIEDDTIDYSERKILCHLIKTFREKK